MALELGGIEEKDHEDRRKSSNGGPEQKTKEEEDSDDDEGENDDEDEEDEPRLKYTSLTKNLRLLYRNGDATSAFLVAGDKMVRSMAIATGAFSTEAEAFQIIGTHNGNIVSDSKLDPAYMAHIWPFT